ncbi:MAG: family 78 glycoside hydrolase catalytic domain [Phycisphaerae bacterium]
MLPRVKRGLLSIYDGFSSVPFEVLEVIHVLKVCKVRGVTSAEVARCLARAEVYRPGGTAGKAHARGWLERRQSQESGVAGLHYKAMMLSLVGLIGLFMWANLCAAAVNVMGPGALRPAAPSHLQVQWRHNPVAINSRHPVLSWRLKWPGRGQHQTAYQILAASSRGLLARNIGDVWNSHKITSSQCVGIKYAGMVLVSGRRYFWKLRVWNQSGICSPWSRIASWREGLLTPTDWRGAQWIGWPSQHPTGVRHPMPATYLRREFAVDKPIKSAVAYICGLGLSRLYVNGVAANHDELSPPLSWYPSRCYYVAVNIAPLLKAGHNAIGVVLGNGRLFGIKAFLPYDIHISPRLLLLLNIHYADGSKVHLVSNGQWQMTISGPIRMDNEYNGETYNANFALPGWSRPDYVSANWHAAKVLTPPGGSLVAMSQQPIRVVKRLAPRALRQIAPGVWIFDFGQNMAGWCRVRLPKSHGAGKIVLRFGESLVRDGQQTMDLTSSAPGAIELYTTNLRTAKQTDTFIYSKRGPKSWHPIFTTHGFRYTEVRGYPGRPTLHTLEGQVVHDALPVAGGFSCSSKLVNKIVHACRWSMQNNWRSIPLDCPQRDERLGWMGARCKESQSEMFLFNAHRFYAKWLWDIQDAQKPNGDISDINPPYLPSYTGNVTWPSTFIVLPGELYRMYGDIKPLQVHYAAMALWVNYQLGKLKNGYSTADQFGDWCAPARSPNRIHTRDPNRLTPKAVLASAMLYKDLKLMAGYARLLHKPQDQARWLTAAGKLYAAFNRHVYHAHLGYYGNGSDTSCILPLAAGIVPADRRSSVIKRLMWRINARQGGHVGCGVIGLQWMFGQLSACGHSNAAWKMLDRASYPGWGFMVRHGATSIWELWNGNTARPAMNSQDHVMLIGDMVSWLFKDVAGIKSGRHHPGFRHIVMQPTLLHGLTWVHAWHRSPYGLIVSNWQLTPKGLLRWRIQVPANSDATVKIPAKTVQSVQLDGHAIGGSSYVKLVGFRDEVATCRVESGNYDFTSQAP